MPLQTVPMFCSINPQGLIPGATVGPGQNIMVSSTMPSSGPVAQGPASFYYPGVYPGLFHSHGIFIKINIHV